MLVAAAIGAPPAWAADPVALVEDVVGPSPGVGAFEYLAAGRRLQLAAGTTLVISYLTSCGQETIRGGTVVVGRERSEVVGGRVERTHMECDTKARLSSDQAKASGVMVFRAPPRRPGAPPPPDARVRGPAVVVDRGGPGALRVERADRPEAPRTLTLARNDLRGGRIADLERLGVPLAVDGTYRITGPDGRSLVVLVEAAPDGRPVPAASRLVELAAR
ncbi:MAG: hypothetical protein ACK5WM_17470 [Rhodospirillales bacterium]